MESNLVIDKTWTESTYKEKQTIWRYIRQNVSKGNIDILLSEFNIPYSRREIDYYTPASWPTPWEMLEMKTLCKSCITLLMFHTLAVCNWANLRLILIDDRTDRYLILVHNDQIYNLYPGRKTCISELKSVIIIEEFNIESIKVYK